MAGSKFEARSAKAWRLARRQHGLVTSADLLRLGFTRKGIEHRLTTGRLHPVARGVYAVGWPQLTPERRWMAAVLACGAGATLSHRSAGALWGIATERDSRVDVSSQFRRRHRQDWIHARTRPALSPKDRTVRKGVPVTTPARTLLDLATVLGSLQLERAVNEADKRDLIDPEELRAALTGYGGEPGVRTLRLLLDRDTFLLSDSDLEILFRPIAVAAGLSTPLSKRNVNGFEVDFHWPELGLVIETDGLRYHRTPSSQARDRVRDQTHIASGLTTLRFTHWQVKFEPAYVAEILRKTAARL